MVTLAGVKVPEKFLNFQRYFFPENDVWECACYFFFINKFTSMPQRTNFLA